MHKDFPELMETLVVKVDQIGEWADEDVKIESGTNFDVKAETGDTTSFGAEGDPSDPYTEIIKTLSKPRIYMVCAIIHCVTYIITLRSSPDRTREGCRFHIPEGAHKQVGHKLL